MWRRPEEDRLSRPIEKDPDCGARERVEHEIERGCGTPVSKAAAQLGAEELEPEP